VDTKQQRDYQRDASLSALTTEHFVMQMALGTAVSEGQGRANMFIGALSGALVAMGFATQSTDIFVPFVATIVPAIFVMGVLTTLRLVDISVESAMAEIRIANIRSYYRTLGPDAETLFAEALGRWPEGAAINPALRLGAFFGYWTSAASMTAALTALVGAAGATLLLRLAAGVELSISLLAGIVVALGLLYGFHQFQKLRIAESDRFAHETAGIPR
jgi:hypothetical protein